MLSKVALAYTSSSSLQMYIEQLLRVMKQQGSYSLGGSEGFFMKSTTFFRILELISVIRRQTVTLFRFSHLKKAQDS